jgi:hypothetical protein
MTYKSPLLNSATNRSTNPPAEGQYYQPTSKQSQGANTMQPLTKDIDGVQHVSSAGLLLMAADAARDDEHPRAQAVIKEVIAAAKAAGYTKGGIVETLLAMPQSHRRTAAAQDVCAHLTTTAFKQALQRAGFND